MHLKNITGIIIYYRYPIIQNDEAIQDELEAELAAGEVETEQLVGLDIVPGSVQDWVGQGGDISIGAKLRLCHLRSISTIRK